MALIVSPEIEARIVFQARAEGMAPSEYLELVLRDAEVLRYFAEEAKYPAEFPPHHEIRAKIDRGLAELEAGQGVDGDEFMEQLINELGNNNPHS